MANMIPVIASTNSDSPKIESAGVDKGLKILVDVEGSLGSPAEAAGKDDARVTRICSAHARFELLNFSICIRQFLLRVRSGLDSLPLEMHGAYSFPSGRPMTCTCA